MAIPARAACLLLLVCGSALAVDDNSLIQVNQQAPAEGKPIFSFVRSSDDECLEGHAREVHGALAILQAGPVGSLYVDSAASLESCASRNFTSKYSQTDGSDWADCFPGITVWKRDSSAVLTSDAQPDHFKKALSAHMESSGDDQLAAMNKLRCSCPSHSVIGKDMRKEGKSKTCQHEGQVGSWVHVDPEDGHELICDEGPYSVALRALAVLKSSQQLPMHAHDTVKPVSCKSRGFTVMYPAIDHCFPALRVWTRLIAKKDPGFHESMNVEGALFGGGGSKYMKDRNLNELLVNDPRCNCLSDSEIGKTFDGMCKYIGEKSRSPVRDWWNGEE